MLLRSFLFLCAASLMFLSGHSAAQTAREYLLTADQTSGAVQFRDPTTLDIVSSIKIQLSTNSTGIDGIFADRSGDSIYVEGPEHDDPNGWRGCCWFYSIELPSLQAKVAAGIWGTKSRRRFVKAGLSLASVSDEAIAATQIVNDEWRISPDGHWWAGFRSGPSVDLFDAKSNKMVKSFTAERGDPEWYLDGAWIKDQFYIGTAHGGSVWLWHVSADSNRLEEPLAVPNPSVVQGCESEALLNMSAIGDRLLLYEGFGGTIDRRIRCPLVEGGALIIDIASKQVAMAFATQLYFWKLVPSRDGTTLFGITSPSQDAELGIASQLVSLDAHSGEILQTRPLEMGYWSIAAATLNSTPSGEKLVDLPAESNDKGETRGLPPCSLRPPCLEP